MFRVSTNMPNDDIQYRLRRKEEEISAIQAKIANQSRIKELRDDPLAASHAVRYASYINRLERFEKNTLEAREHYEFVDGYMRQANDIMQRVRELAVQGANGIYSREDTAKMGVEVNELLKELSAIANATGKDGKYLFSGDKAFTIPFRIVEGTVDGLGYEAPIRVEYRGAGAERRVEISDQTYSRLDIGGGEAFWAEKMIVSSTIDASDYAVPAESSIFIDGVEIPVNTGDNVRNIVAKINDSAAPVKAYIDPETRAIVVEGTEPHFIRMEDAVETAAGGAAGSVLRDLGLIRANSEQGAPNWAPGARVSGGSLFDVVIGLRDAMLNGDQLYIGGQGLGGVDQAMANLQTRIADIGSRAERVENAWGRINTQIPNVTESLSREAGLDLASASVEFNMMDMAHKAALQTAARIIPPTLMDFLR
ncbi:MAG: flagellar hook-associated protein 3 [Spirochaetaceae bacterium]|jgi:flagellar hook-associated protein 3 FlgL|nr:flagellar hook-associated protein 3 [Spirochaetaceae bacterium]